MQTTLSTKLTKDLAIAIASQLMLLFPTRVNVEHPKYGVCIVVEASQHVQLAAIARLHNLELVFDNKRGHGYLGIFN